MANPLFEIAISYKNILKNGTNRKHCQQEKFRRSP